MSVRLKTTPKRSRNMSAIRGTKNKSTELELLKLLRKNRITGWRRHSAVVFGKPDFIFSGQKVAIFVDGCFWHGCKDIKKSPVANKNFWVEKIKNNKIRDSKVTKTLRKEGWKVVRIWEHELKRSKASVVAKIAKHVKLEA